jgi:thioester reductase-like protein
MDRSILLTGATGFLGGHLLLYLLKHTDAAIYCLARRKPAFSTADRLRRRLTEILAASVAGDPRFQVNLDSEWSRVHVLEGDLRQNRLGLTVEQDDSICVDEIWHVGAEIDFSEQRRHAIFETNLKGILHILEFARTHGNPTLNYVSTAYVCGTRFGSIPDEPIDGQFPTNNAYEESKRAAERAVLSAYTEGDLPIRIFRPSIIVGHSRTHDVDKASGMHAYLLGLFQTKEAIDLRIPDHFERVPMTFLVGDDATLNLISVDHVVEAMYRIACRRETIGEIVHITNPYPTDLPKLLQVLEDVLVPKVETSSDIGRLNPIDLLVGEKTKPFRPYFLNNKLFDCSKMLRFLNLPAEVFRITESAKRQLVQRSFDFHLSNPRRQALRHRLATTAALPHDMRFQ